jgi:hypothetical protein
MVAGDAADAAIVVASNAAAAAALALALALRAQPPQLQRINGALGARVG